MRRRRSRPANSRRRQSSAGIATLARKAVLDASAVLRGHIGEQDAAAREWIASILRGDVEALAPEILFAEAANGLLVLVRARRLTDVEADAIVDEIVALPLEAVSLRRLARTALPLANARGLSVYDACYLAVAEAWDAVLVTADQRLAAAAGQSVLLP